MSDGFAAKQENGELLVNTVSDTKRAAMVNWLVTETKIAVWHDWSDLKIANTFDAYAFSRRVTIVPVSIAESNP